MSFGFVLYIAATEPFLGLLCSELNQGLFNIFETVQCTVPSSSFLYCCLADKDSHLYVLASWHTVLSVFVRIFVICLLWKILLYSMFYHSYIKSRKVNSFSSCVHLHNYISVLFFPLQYVLQYRHLLILYFHKYM